MPDDIPSAAIRTTITAFSSTMRTGAIGALASASGFGLFEMIRSSLKPIGDLIQHRITGHMDMTDVVGVEIIRLETFELYFCIIGDLERHSTGTVTRYVENPDGLQRIQRVDFGYHSRLFNHQWINFEVDDDKIVIWMYQGMKRKEVVAVSITAYLHLVYHPPTPITYHYIQKGSEWDIPQRKRGHVLATLTPSQQNFMAQVNIFLESTRAKMGCFIHGAPATGKSAIIQHMSTTLHRKVYHLVLNDAGMTDVVFASLVASVQPNSILVLDEFEKQYVRMESNPNNLLSDGGILKSLDGPIPVSHKVIIILISNTNIADPETSALPAQIREPLFRVGRIGRIFEFTEVVVEPDE